MCAIDNTFYYLYFVTIVINDVLFFQGKFLIIPKRGVLRTYRHIGIFDMNHTMIRKFLKSEIFIYFSRPPAISSEYVVKIFCSIG